MLLEIYAELKNDKLDEFINAETELWEVIPGIAYAEKRVDSLAELCSFMSKCEEITGLPLGFDMQLAPKNHEDDEEMFVARIYCAKKPIAI